ncbi:MULTISPECIES: hypothetical protein [unclassified Streptomyces]|uniref:hypothetical protein n=1 Tax=unclassified Streptomyces TaxID=2593676 RepID=UPI0036A24CA1
MKALRYLIVPLALGMALTGVSASAAVPADSIPLGVADNGTSKDVRDGELVVVRLDAYTTEDGLTYTFGDPASSDEAAVAPIAENPGNFRVTGAAEAATADITAPATCVASEGATAACPDPVLDWKVTINVAAKVPAE